MNVLRCPGVLLNGSEIRARSSFLLSIVGTTLDEVVYLSLQYVADLLKETLPVVENVVFVFDKGQTEHEKDTGGAA